jgi:predicted transcriptional regulator
VIVDCGGFWIFCHSIESKSNAFGVIGLFVVSVWYHAYMGMTLRTSDQQTEALRKQAAAEGRSMQAVALAAIDEYIARRTHKAKVASALQRVVREEAGVLERLKDA